MTDESEWKQLQAVTLAGNPAAVLALLVELAAVKAELAITEKLLNERNRVLEAIPECGAHGAQCVPHAIE